MNNSGASGAKLENLHAATRSAVSAAELLEAHLALGSELRRRGWPQFALLHLDHAVEIDSRCAAAHYERSLALRDLRDRPAALHAAQQALACDPDLPWAQGLRLQLQRDICSWADDDSSVVALESAILQGRPVTTPFTALTVSARSAVQRAAAQRWSHEIVVPANAVRTPVRRRSERIRVGYISPDLSSHPVGRMTRRIVALHDRGRFEIVGVTLAPGRDNVTEEFERSCDAWLDVSPLDDTQAIDALRSLELDIAVDLAGHTGAERMEIFAARVAPVQVNFIGYPGTAGTPWHDYIVADRTVLPDSARGGYTEQALHLECFQPNDDTRKPASPWRATSGSCTYCCLNGNHKMTPRMFGVWMNILRRVPGSTLMLYASSAEAEANLRSEAVRAGVAPERLRFTRRVDTETYMALYQQADVFLDTFPFNGGATVSDAMWSGVPVVTICGDPFASRMAASLLARAGLPEFAVTDFGAYEDLAVRLASAPAVMASARGKLGAELLHNVYDTPSYVRELEDAYMRIHEAATCETTPA